AFEMNPMEQQIVNQENHWKLANRKQKLPKVAPSAFGQTPMFRIAIESSAKVQYVFLDIMHKASQGQLQGLMGKLIKGYKLSLLVTSDAHRVREQLVGGIQTRSEKVEIFSETQKQRQSEIKKLKKDGFQESRFSNQRQNPLERVNYRNNQNNRNFFPLMLVSDGYVLETLLICLESNFVLMILNVVWRTKISFPTLFDRNKGPRPIHHCSVAVSIRLFPSQIWLS
ncbi:MAG: hypothetical protein EZS28_047533, partial [Streblomastix strix]